MSDSEDDRLRSELSLLDAMYPGQVVYDELAREVKYTSEHGSFRLRLPPGYLNDQLPEVITATAGREDAREMLKERVSGCSDGEEVLDAVISQFNELSELNHSNENDSNHNRKDTAPVKNENVVERVTVVVWLHHLLNTNKRKQALFPASSSVSGLTKPGYPGVLVYSGPRNDVQEHVNELKQLNWQAFSVRLESDEEWSFKHGASVKEFETMKEVVSDLRDDKKETFMEAMRMK